MVLADSHGIPRAPRYSGTHSRRLRNFHLRESHPLRSHIPMRSASHHRHTLQNGSPGQAAPQPRSRNACRLSHAIGLASSRFARHYSGNHGCFLFLQVLRCFSSPRSSYRPMSSDGSDPTSLRPGFPIRTPSDHSSFDNSPRTIAAYHVLHQLLVPRHPPCAHHTCHTKKMLATSAVQFSKCVRGSSQLPLRGRIPAPSEPNSASGAPPRELVGLASERPAIMPALRSRVLLAF